MQSAWEQKASAGDLSPGFFHFVLFVIIAMVFVVQIGLCQEQKILRRLTIGGTTVIASDVILRWLDSRPGGRFNPSDVQTIASHYATEGYPMARVDSLAFRQTSDTSQIDLCLWVSEGRPAHVSTILFEGLKAIKESEVRATWETAIGRKFVPATLEHDIGTLLNAYEGKGYAFAKVSLNDISFKEEGDSLGVSITLAVEEGTLTRIHHLRVEGNTTTKSGIVLREAKIEDGELFRGDQPEKIQQRLQRTQLFSAVSLPELYVLDDGTAGLLVKVTEGNPNRFDGVLGYMPPAGSNDGYFTGLVDVQFRNILGTARRFAARWYRENQSSQEINLQYHEPWVASLPVNAGVEFFQRKQDSTYIRSTFRFAADLMASDELSVGLVLSTEQVTPTEGFGQRIVSENHSTDIGVAISYDSRNDPVTPTSGISYRTEYTTGLKRIQSSLLQPDVSRSATQRLTFDFEYVTSPFERQVISASLHAKDFSSSAVEASDLFRLGGANTLRGYREGQFVGSRIAWTNLEYRFLAGQRSYFFGFVDGGYVLTPDRPEVGLIRQELKKIGYGVGIRLDTPLGFIGVSLAFGEGDTFSTSKLHIRLANEF